MRQRRRWEVPLREKRARKPRGFRARKNRPTPHPRPAPPLGREEGSREKAPSGRSSPKEPSLVDLPAVAIRVVTPVSSFECLRGEEH